MNKAQVRLKKQNIVMDIDDAVALFKLLSKAGIEVIDYDYVKADAEKGTSSRSVYYVEPTKDLLELTSVNDEDYAMMKLYASTREHE
jgi:extradiol dioxygenase family protein